MPHLHQSSRSEPHSQMKVEGVNDLAERESLKKMQQRGQNERAISKSAARQHIGDLWFDAFFAVGAPIAMNDFFGDDWLEVFWDVFGNA